MEKPFQNVTVIGTGTLGTQIALLAGNAGYRVTVYDTQKGVLSAILKRLRSSIEAKGITPLIPWDRLETIREGIRETTHLDEAVQQADLIVESVPEDLKIKQAVFGELGKKAPPEAILATNSSSMPVSRLEQSSGRPEKCLNTHFYVILEGMNMADVMGGTKTTPEVLQKGVDWVRSMGCIALTVNKELLGFCFNRVWRAIKRETLWMWANGYVDFRDVDRAWMTFTKMKVGPFGIMDSVGLDVVRDIEMVYFNQSKDPKDRPPRALLDKIDRGELGVKSGRGFYTYPDPEFAKPEFLDSTK